MRDEVRQRLAARGVQMADSTFAAGTKILEQQLGYEVARYVFGPAAERRRRVTDDPQIGQAVALLRQAADAERAAGSRGRTAAPSSLIDDPDAGGHLEAEGAVRHRLIDPHLRQRQRARRRPSAR